MLMRSDERVTPAAAGGAILGSVKRQFLLWFGVLGLAITCFQGLGPFLDVSQIVAWAISHWVAWTREFWQAIFLGLAVPIAIRDSLTGFVYLTSFILCFRNRRRHLYPRYVRFCETIDRLIERHWIMWPLPHLVHIPMVIVLMVLSHYSTYAWITFSVVASAIMLCESWMRGERSRRFAATLFGRIEDRDPDIYISSVAFIFLSYYVVATLVGLLIVNEIGTYADDLRDFLRWVTCEAGITCGATTSAPDQPG